MHTAAVPRELVEARAGRFDYFVSIHRFDRPKDFLVYPIGLADRLPEIAIPLLPGDPDVPLNLKEMFLRAYDAGPYAREVEYGKDPIVPRLRPEQAEWATAVLKSRSAATDHADRAISIFHRAPDDRTRRPGTRLRPASAKLESVEPLGHLWYYRCEVREAGLEY